jgi:hypothetical protein
MKEYVKISLNRYEALIKLEEAYNSNKCLVTNGWMNGNNWQTVWVKEKDEVIQHLRDKIEELDACNAEINEKLAKSDQAKGIMSFLTRK